MFEKVLALRYLKTQKRHSIFTISSIAVAMALMTMLFVGYSTYRGILRDSAFLDKPYHFKLLRLTEDEFSQLAANQEFDSCKRVVEADYTISAEITLHTYHDDFGLYINTLFPDKYIYSDRFESYKEDLIDVNFDLIAYDQLDMPARYTAVCNLAIFFIFIIFLFLSLRLMIDTAFEISSKERERQFGMLQCMGAAPGQIVRIITFEGMYLSIIGIPAGILLGLAVSAGAFALIKTSGISEAFFDAEKAAQVMHIHFAPLLLLLAAVTGLVWVFLSAYQTGMRIIKMTPIQAISGRGNKIFKVRQFSLFGTLFGWKGKLAARNNRRQPKRFAITVVSLTLSIALFASFSVVLRQSMASFEKTVEMLGLNYDMSISIKVDPTDPLGYQKGLDLIRSSGYFDIEDFCKTQLAYYGTSDDKTVACILQYFPRELFDKQFDGEVPVSYDELTQQNGYLVMIQDGTEDSPQAERFAEPSTIRVAVKARRLVTDEEYDKMSASEKEEVKEYIQEDYVTGEKVLKYRYTSADNPADLKILGAAPEKGLDEDAKQFLGYEAAGSDLLILAGTLDSFENGSHTLSGEGSWIGSELEPVSVNLKDDNDYEKAKSFLGLNAGILTLDADFYGDLQKMRTVMGVVQIGMGFLSVLIGIIALVNMVNILSTGILNRKSELAAMQCLGMTKGQLYGMTFIECLQYALTAGVLATALLEGMMGLMVLLLKKVELYEVFQEMIQFGEPLPRIWIASAVAFAAAVLASFIPLHRMEQESLTDQIRTIE